jgi:hypothetical protein
VVQFRSVSGDLRVVGPSSGNLLAIPRPPAPPAPPAPPTEAPDGTAAEPDAEPGDAVTEAARLDILRALERGEIDIDEATKRLADLDGSTDA